VWYCVTTDASLLSASGAASSTLTVGPGRTISRHTVVLAPGVCTAGASGGRNWYNVMYSSSYSTRWLCCCYVLSSGGNLVVIVLNGCMWIYFVMDIVVEILKAPEVVLLLVAR